MKLQLINAPIKFTSSLSQGDLGEAMYPPLGILYLASSVRKQFPDIEIKVTDGMLKGHKRVVEDIDSFAADIIGISSATPNASGSFEISRYIKKNYPERLVVMGGIHPTSLPKDTLLNSRCDFVALGEGEKILTAMVERFMKTGSFKGGEYKEIRGVAYLNKKKYVQNPYMAPIFRLEEIPFPARDLVDLGQYSGWTVSKKRPETSIFSNRGCPFYCHFCSNLVWKLQPPFVRLRSPKNVMDEVEILIKDFGIREYFDHADEINASLEWTAAVCREKIKRKLDIPWKAMLRADKMTKTLAGLLAKSNCWYVHLGIESGNQETIDGVGKRITLDQVVNCCKLLKEQGIKICGLFMLFNVWEKNNKLEYEDTEMTDNTLQFAKKLLDEGLIDNMTCSQATPYPGSKLYETALKHRLIPKKYQKRWELWNHSWSFVMKLPKVKEKDKVRIKSKGIMLANWQMIKTGNIPWNDLPFLISKGWRLVRRLFLFRLGLRLGLGLGLERRLF